MRNAGKNLAVCSLLQAFCNVKLLAVPHPTSLTLGHLKVNCPKGAREATLGCLPGRGLLGAYQNRLEYTLNSLAASEENLTAAESRIRDVDMASEMMELTKNNILQQAAQAMLVQANQTPQQALQLLQ